MITIARYNSHDGGNGAWPLCRQCADIIGATRLGPAYPDDDCARCGIRASRVLGLATAFVLKPFDTAGPYVEIDGIPGQIWYSRYGIEDVKMFVPDGGVRNNLGQPCLWWHIEGKGVADAIA